MTISVLFVGGKELENHYLIVYLLSGHPDYDIPPTRHGFLLKKSIFKDTVSTDISAKC